MKILKYIKKKFQNFTKNKIAIDLGTANIVIYDFSTKEIIINEPSVIAGKYYDGIFVPEAVGNEAKLMIGRAPENYLIVRPMKNGVISNFDLTYAMLNIFCKKAFAGSFFFIPKKILIGVPYEATALEKKAINESVQGHVNLITESFAAALGADLPIYSSIGNMIIDIGGGTTEISVIALGGIVKCKCINFAGDVMDEAIIEIIKKKYSLLVGTNIAEEVKKKIGSAYLEEKEEEIFMTIKGREIISGMPLKTEISNKIIYESLKPICEKILEKTKQVLGEIDPTLSADIINNGIKLTGGGALLKNLDIFLKKSLNISVTIAENPLFCVIKGLSLLLEKKYKF